MLIAACERTVIKNYPEIQVDNPFDDIDYGNGVINEIELDSTSFLGLHTHIFTPSCAQPGCHDGNFEPDFRTVQSAWHTLVYHDVVKNDEDESYDFRVVPGSRNMSWLWERVTTDDSVLGRMPLYDVLPDYAVENIGKWIDAGAPDAFGYTPGLPDYQPTVFGWLAYENDPSGFRFDTIRADEISPIELPAGITVNMWFGVYDIVGGVFAPGFDLDYNKIRITSHPFEFDESLPYQDLTVQPAAAPHNGPLFFDDGYTVLPYYHQFSINTDDFPTGQVQYVRIYVQDDSHPEPTEWPNDNSPLFYHSLMSFVVQ